MKRMIFKTLAVLPTIALVVSAQAATVEWSGFGSGRVGKAMNEKLHPAALESHKTEFGAFSKFGLNVGASLSDRLDVAAQFIAGGGSATTGSIGSNAWDLNTNWAFASYKVFDGMKIKYGRQLLPNWLAAEYAQVGYLQPMREIPASLILASFFKNFNGGLAEYVTETPVGALTVSGWAGDVDIEGSLGGTSFTSSLSSIYGGGVTLSGDGYKFRTQYTTFVDQANFGGVKFQADVQQITVGASYDKHNIVVWSEYGAVQSKNASAGIFTGPGTELFKEGSAYYVMGGYRFDKWLPRLTYTSADMKDIGIMGLNGIEEIWTAGLNYQIDPSAVIKIDYEMASVDKAKDGASYRRNGGTDTRGDAIYAGIDFVF